MSPKQIRPRPRDYTPDAVQFGQRIRVRWLMPEGGNHEDLTFARQQHLLACRIRATQDRTVIGLLAHEAGVARTTMSDFMGGRRWMTRAAVAAVALYLGSSEGPRKAPSKAVVRTSRREVAVYRARRSGGSDEG